MSFIGGQSENHYLLLQGTIAFIRLIFNAIDELHVYYTYLQVFNKVGYLVEISKKTLRFALNFKTDFAGL